jgi:hypothetical protein
MCFYQLCKITASERWSLARGYHAVDGFVQRPERPQLRAADGRRRGALYKQNPVDPFARNRLVSTLVSLSKRKTGFKSLLSGQMQLVPLRRAHDGVLQQDDGEGCTRCIAVLTHSFEAPGFNPRN